MSHSHLRWWSNPRALLRAILMLDDSQHSIALGTSLGMFIGLTPTMGIQMLLVMIVAFVTRPFFRFNRIAALITVYVSNPLTTVPIYYFLYRVLHADNSRFRDELRNDQARNTVVDVYARGTGSPQQVSRKSLISSTAFSNSTPRTVQLH